MRANLLTASKFENGGLRLCRLFLAFATLALAACSSSSAVEQQSKIAMSAAQTATMILDGWAAGAAPSHYATAALQSSVEMLAEAARQIQSDNAPDAAERRGVITAISRLSAAATRARAGIEAGNPRHVSQARQDLRTAATDLAAVYVPRP